MNPTEYEQQVARLLRQEGWTAAVTLPAAGSGVDVIAEQRDRKLGVQAKMYGAAGRVVNQQVIHELFGAASAQGCNEFMLATDAAVSTDARASAEGSEWRSGRSPRCRLPSRSSPGVRREPIA